MSELSKVTGLSRVTISKVINGRPGVSEETRRRVLEACEAFNFHPNAAARSLVRKRTDQIAVILAGPDLNGWWGLTTWYVEEYLRGILSAAEAVGLNVLLCTQRASSALRRDPGRLIRSRQADALLLVGSWVTKEQAESLLESKVPFAVLGTQPPGISTNVIYYDNEKGVHAAVERLAALGHRLIEYVVFTPEGHAKNHISRMRYKAFQEALETFGCAAEISREMPVALERFVESRRQGAKATAALVAAPVQVAVPALQAAGVGIPEDLSIIVIDDHPAARYGTPRLSALRQPLAEIGHRAVRELKELIDADEYTFPTILLPMELVMRESTRELVRQPTRDTLERT